MPINKVGSKGITDGSVASAEFADGIVTSAKLQSGAVTNVKLTNTTFTLSGTSVSLGASATLTNKFVDWQSVITADGSTGTTGVAGRGYFINTTSAAHTFTLPASATRGDTIAIKDYAGTFATYNLTIARNGHNIQGVANNSLISTNRASVVLVYIDVTRGWEFVEESNVADLQERLFITATGGTITTTGNFKIHTFTGDGCFVVSQVGNPVGSDKVDYLVVAGGGGGGRCGGAGGGAGGYRTTFPSPGCNAGSFPITATTYPITVGSGGAGKIGAGKGANGSNSIFSTITSTGGGGGSGRVGAGNENGGAGGSGGGAQYDFPCSQGAGNTPPVASSPLMPGGQGFPGGPKGAPGNDPGGGGGGASAAGNPTGFQTSPTAGKGGDGLANSISGSPVTYAGGGGGGGPNGAPGNTGGSGGGGRGSPSLASGTANTGGGGGGCTADTVPAAGSGGKGIVIIRYKFQ